mmetsp:Transcript_41353/g.104814  ORF Transcript_41353/g.104814 Transcript_41353/m.104814 type:complete len:256 (-) Transcript_41353:317-1084(-)
MLCSSCAWVPISIASGLTVGCSGAPHRPPTPSAGLMPEPDAFCDTRCRICMAPMADVPMMPSRCCRQNMFWSTRKARSDDRLPAKSACFMVRLLSRASLLMRDTEPASFPRLFARRSVRSMTTPCFLKICSACALMIASCTSCIRLVSTCDTSSTVLPVAMATSCRLSPSPSVSHSMLLDTPLAIARWTMSLSVTKPAKYSFRTVCTSESYGRMAVSRCSAASSSRHTPGCAFSMSISGTGVLRTFSAKSADTPP